MAFLTIDDIYPYLSDDSSSLTLTTDDQTLLNNIIDSVCTFIEGYIKNPVEVKTFVELTSGNGTPYIVTQYCPIVSVDEIRIDESLEFGDETIVDLSSFVVDYQNGSFYYKNGILPDKEFSVKITYKAGYDVVPSDLKDVACQMVIIEYDKIRKRELGVNNVTGFKENVVFIKNEDLLPEHKVVLSRYFNTRL